MILILIIYIDMMDAAVDRNIIEQVRDIIFDVIKPIRKKSKWPDSSSVISILQEIRQTLKK